MDRPPAFIDGCRVRIDKWNGKARFFRQSVRAFYKLKTFIETFGTGCAFRTGYFRSIILKIMKKLFTLCISIAILFLSCEKEAGSPTGEADDPMKRALEEIGRNRKVLDQAWAALAQRLPADSIGKIRKSADTRAEFIVEMKGRTQSLFKDAIKSNDPNQRLDYYLKLPDIEPDTNAAAISRLFVHEQPLGEYVARLTRKVKESKKDRWVLVKAYRFPDGTTLPIPQEQATVNREQLLAAIRIAEIVADPALNEQEQETAIEELVKKAGLPPLTIILLVPAVQKYTEEPSADPFMNWLNTGVKPAIGGGMNRDIIRRVAAAALLGNLEHLLSGEYRNDNQVSASLQLLENRFNTSLVFLWNEVWNEF